MTCAFKPGDRVYYDFNGRRVFGTVLDESEAAGRLAVKGCLLLIPDPEAKK